MKKKIRMKEKLKRRLKEKARFFSKQAKKGSRS